MEIDPRRNEAAINGLLSEYYSGQSGPCAVAARFASMVCDEPELVSRDLLHRIEFRLELYRPQKMLDTDEWGQARPVPYFTTSAVAAQNVESDELEFLDDKGNVVDVIGIDDDYEGDAFELGIWAKLSPEGLLGIGSSDVYVKMKVILSPICDDDDSDLDDDYDLDEVF